MSEGEYALFLTLKPPMHSILRCQDHRPGKGSKLSRPFIGREQTEVRIAAIREHRRGRNMGNLTIAQSAGQRVEVGEDGIELGRFDVLQHIPTHDQIIRTRRTRLFALHSRIVFVNGEEVRRTVRQKRRLERSIPTAVVQYGRHTMSHHEIRYYRGQSGALVAPRGALLPIGFEQGLIFRTDRLHSGTS